MPHIQDSPQLRAEGLKLQGHPNPLEGLLKHRFLGPTSRVSDSVILGWACKHAFLTSSQVMRMLLVRAML